MLASTTTYHASDGAAYERFLGRWTTLLAAPLLDFAEFPPDGPLLDVGTGTGSLAVAMTARWPSRRIIGIDVAEPYIRYARSRSTAPFLSFEVGEAAHLPFGPGVFSGAAAQLVLNFLPNAEAAVREMRREGQRTAMASARLPVPVPTSSSGPSAGNSEKSSRRGASRLVQRPRKRS